MKVLIALASAFAAGLIAHLIFELTEGELLIFNAVVMLWVLYLQDRRGA